MIPAISITDREFRKFSNNFLFLGRNKRNTSKYKGKGAVS